MVRFALLDGSSNAVDVVDTIDDKTHIANGYRDAAGAGYLWHWDGKAWVDTAAAQAWRAHQESATAAEVQKRAARAKSAAIFAAIRDDAASKGRTIEELQTRLLVDLIQNVPALSRTAIENAFLTAVANAVAANP